MLVSGNGLLADNRKGCKGKRNFCYSNLFQPYHDDSALLSDFFNFNKSYLVDDTLNNEQRRNPHGQSHERTPQKHPTMASATHRMQFTRRCQEVSGTYVRCPGIKDLDESLLSRESYFHYFSFISFFEYRCLAHRDLWLLTN